MLPFFTAFSQSPVIENVTPLYRTKIFIFPFFTLLFCFWPVVMLARRAGFYVRVPAAVRFMLGAGFWRFKRAAPDMAAAKFAGIGFYHSFVLVDHPPNKTPEPTASIAVSPLSRLDVVWSRMAQLRMLGHPSPRWIWCAHFYVLRFALPLDESVRDPICRLMRHAVLLGYQRDVGGFEWRGLHPVDAGMER